MAPNSQTPKVAERPHPLTGVAKSWIVIVGLIVFVGRDLANNGLKSFREFGPFAWGLGAIVLFVVGITLVRGIIEWRTTTFIADDEEFRIERNFISKQSSRISYAKIQSIDIHRALAARMLGLASISIDVGGAGGQKLEYLSRARAEALRDQLLHRMRTLGVSPQVPEPQAPQFPPDDQPDWEQQGGPAEQFAEPVAPRRAQVEPPDFLPPAPETPPARALPPPSVAGPAQQPDLVVHMRSATLLLGLVVSGFLPWLIAAVGILFVGIFLRPGMSIAAFGGILFGIGSYLWSQVTGNWNFRLVRTSSGIHITRGMFTTTSRSLKADRIQAVSIHQDFIQRLTGLHRVRVTVLGFGTGEDAATQADTVLPFGTWQDVQAVLGAFWPGINLEGIPLNSQPARARWLTPLGFRRHLWGSDGQTLVSRHGLLAHTISLVPHRRMQSIHLQQGPVQRLLRLARVGIHTTDGPVRLDIYHLDTIVARELLTAQIDRARIAREQPGQPGYLVGAASPPANSPASPPGTDQSNLTADGAPPPEVDAPPS